jgi:membrane protein
VLKRIWHRLQLDNCFDLAAQTSFYFLLSFFPFCLVLAVIVGWLPYSALWKTFVTWVVTYLPRGSQELVFSTILGLVNYSAGFLSFGLVTTVWSASSGFVSLMESLSIAYGVRDSRSYWRKHAIATVFTILAAMFALGAFGLAALGHWESRILSANLGHSSMSRIVWEIGRWVATLVLLFVAIDLLNFVLPDVRRQWRWLSPGTLFAVVTLMALSAGFNIYFQHFSMYPRVYGALGGFIILMLWVYSACFIVLVGAETDDEMEKSQSEARGR